MKLSPSEIRSRRIGKWVESAKSVKTTPTWVEQRLAIDIGEHTFIVTNGQIFECAHCGHYDPEWNATEVLEFFKPMGIEPYEIEVTCTVAVVL